MSKIKRILAQVVASTMLLAPLAALMNFQRLKTVIMPVPRHGN